MRSIVIVYSARARLVALALKNQETVTLSRVALGGRIPAVYDQRYKCHNLWDGDRCPSATMFTTLRLLQRQQQAYRLRIAISAYPTCIRRPCYRGSRRNIAIPFGIEKLEWCGCPKVKKFRRYLYSFWHNSRTWQTDRHTPHDGIGRAYASHRVANHFSLVYE